MKKALLSFILSVTAFISFSQSSIKGTVTDSVEKKNPENAVVSLMRHSDSVLIKFTRAGKEGQFSFSNLPEGKYILMITHPYMGDYFDNLDVQPGENELGKIYMTPKSKLLADVIIRTGSPIRIKGDTTVYTADSFKVRPGANVEELLRRLPGIQVDKDGKITAMGERVTKVLVDGEEFFGSDPGIATKNLRADAVKEVEVFDKKSDQAEFTGIDDGIKDKTINLKMKQKNGYFGKIELGGGLKDKYSNAAMINSFKNKRKLAAYGIMSNTGQTNLDWDDAQNYGGGMNGMESGITEDGGMWMSVTTEADENYYGGRNGIPQNWNGGIHYSDKYGKDQKQSFNIGYKFSKVNAPAINSSFSKTFLPDSSWQSNSNSNNFNSTNKHALNLTLDFNLDSNNSLKWTSRVNNKSARSSSNYYTETLSEALDSINNSRRNSTNLTDNNNIFSSLLWKHKFKKLSRTISINTDFNWSRSESEGMLYSLNRYYDKGILLTKDTTDQQNIRDNEAKEFSTKVAYTEPLAKDLYLELSYILNYNSNSNERITNRKSINGKYEDIVDSLSNKFIFDRLVNTPGINFRLNKKKYNFSFGSSVGFSHFIQKNITGGTRTNYNFTNFFPRASFQYKFKPSENMRFSYNGSTTAPSLEQLQPIRVNTDPLNIYTGNPELEQSFRHSLNGSYNFYNVLKEQNLWTNMNMNVTQNAFVQSSTVDSVGKRTFQTVNANGIYSFNVFADYGFKVTKAKIRLGFGPTVNMYRNIDFVNGVKNITNTKGYGIRMNISKYVDNKYNFHIGPEISWNSSKASLNSDANANYWELKGWANAQINLPKKFEFSTNAGFEIRQKDPRFTQQNSFTTWNASIIKRFFKDNDLEVSLGLNDILNQNRGYQRNFNSYSFSESYFTTLRRFWLLTLTWNISKNGKPASF